MKKQSNTLFLAQSAMIAAIYVVLTVILAPFLMGTVGIGEVISCGILGMIVYTILDKHRVAIFRTAA